LDDSLAATYSASVVDRAIRDYFFDFREIAILAQRKRNAAVEWQSIGSPAKSELVKPAVAGQQEFCSV